MPVAPFRFVEEHDIRSQPWGTQDRRDVARGSNTAIFGHRAGRWPRARHEARHLLTDWGGAMGKWRTIIVTRGGWDVDGFEAQTPQFVTGALVSQHCARIHRGAAG